MLTLSYNISKAKLHSVDNSIVETSLFLSVTEETILKRPSVSFKAVSFASQISNCFGFDVYKYNIVAY